MELQGWSIVPGCPHNPSPFWTTVAYPERGGQDHLGLASVVQGQILPAISPGVNVLNCHPRLYAFYCFAIDEFWRRHEICKASALYEWVQRLRSIVATYGWCSRRAATRSTIAWSWDRLPSFSASSTVRSEMRS